MQTFFSIYFVYTIKNKYFVSIRIYSFYNKSKMVIQIVNNNPNINGLKFRKKQEKLKRANDLILAEKARLKRYKDIGAEPDEFIDRFIIDMADKYQNEPKVATCLLKWQEIKKKYSPKYNPLLGEE